jgi:chitin disaccharide deacetylase
MEIHLQADDVGIGVSATQIILEAWENGFLNGFGIVANVECKDLISESLLKNKSLDCTLSAHLNLTDGTAQSSYIKGSFISKPDGRLKIGFGKALFLLLRGGSVKQQFLQEVYSEWDLQLQFIRDVCGDRKLMAVNGHNHIHMLPSLFSIATQLAAKYEIPHVRVVNEHFLIVKMRDLTKAFFLLNICKWVTLTICRYRIKQKQIHYSALSDEVFGVLYSGHITTDAIRKVINKVKKRGRDSLEIVLHPGQSLPHEMDKWASTASGKLFFIHPSRKKEMDVLKQLQREDIFANKQN